MNKKTTTRQIALAVGIASVMTFPAFVYSQSVTAPGSSGAGSVNSPSTSTSGPITSPGSSTAGRVTSPSTGIESPGGRAADPQTAPIQQVQDPNAPTGTIGADMATSEIDRTLNQAIRQSLSEETSLASSFANIQMETENGTVTLHGSVPTAKEKADIIARVKRTTGVKKVDDQLKITSASPQS
ncbi:MAG: BON domain-containing protein [Terriglobia bacterium]